MKQLKHSIRHYFWNPPKYNILDFIPQQDYYFVMSSVCLVFAWNYHSPHFTASLNILSSRKIRPLLINLL